MKDGIYERLIEQFEHSIRKATPTETCMAYWDTMFQYTYTEIHPHKEIGSPIALPKKEAFEKHLWNCPFCYREYRILKDELLREAYTTEDNIIEAQAPASLNIRELISRLTEKAGEWKEGFSVSLTPLGHAYRSGHTYRGETGVDQNKVLKFYKSSPEHLELYAELKPDYQFILILEYPDGKKKVFFPHLFWETDRGREQILRDEDSISIILTTSDESTAPGEYRFLVFFVKGLDIEPISIPFGDIEAHDGKAEELLSQIAEIPAGMRLSEVCTYKIL